MLPTVVWNVTVVPLCTAVPDDSVTTAVIVAWPFTGTMFLSTESEIVEPVGEVSGTLSHEAATTAAITANDAGQDASRRNMLAVGLWGAAIVLVAFGLAVGSEGFSLAALRTDLMASDSSLIVGQIRAPRTLGALLVGALLGLAGAIAQGLFRNPLADPYLLGSAAGASLGVVLASLRWSIGGWNR